VFGIFAATALLFAAIGLSAVIAYAVRQRTREIGVRMALGARGSDVVRLVVREAAELTLIALAIGVGTTWILTRAIANLLFRVAPSDPATLVATTILLAAVALVAAYLPARRATRIDPLIALRTE
jgi:ABC-type antimicrobial peptide transport system permease subunit